MKFRIKKNKWWDAPHYGYWYIVTNERPDERYLWRDLELHSSCLGDGYFGTKQEAEECLRKYKEKNKMNNIEINVKVNGQNTPLHEISEQTLLAIREASKPKPVFQVCQYGTEYLSRLIFKLPNNVGEFAGQYVAMDQAGHIVYWADTFKGLINEPPYTNFRELKLKDVK